MAALDWDSIERAYRAGVMSLREIATEHNCTHGAIRKRAARDGWSRDLSAKIAAEAEALVSKDAVSTSVSTDTKIAEREIVTANAELQASVLRSHRRDIGRLRTISDTLAGRLEQDAAEGDRSDCIEDAGKLAGTLKTLIGLERQAFNLDAKAPPSNGLSDVPSDNVRRLIAKLDEHIDAIA